MIIRNNSINNRLLFLVNKPLKQYPVKPNSTRSFFYIVILLILPWSTVFSQGSGTIIRQATSVAGRSVLDPNSDGFTSATSSGFGTNDVTNSEISFKGIKAYAIEPFGDLRRGPNHGYSDFVPDSAGNGVYHSFSAANNVLFRMRMGGIMAGSKGYSIMMDTDGKFGATGANADPNYLPSTTGVNGNPGFEIEVVLETNFRIAVYNVDGTSSPVLVKQYTSWQDMSQVSIASTNDNGDPDYLIDFYIPFSDLQAAPFNLNTSSSIRMTATTVMSPGAAIGGPRSDIYGVSSDQYEDFINAQPACSIFTSSPSCQTAMCTAAPFINSPINAGTVNISGTWTKSLLAGAAATAAITVYKNGASIGTVSNVSSGSTWILNNIVLVNGDIITAKAQATGENMCLSSNSVTASSCNASNRPATPTLVCTSGSKGLEGTNFSTGWTIHVDNVTRNVPDNHVTNATGLFSAPTGTSPNMTWQFSGGCTSGAPLTSGSYKVYYTNDATGCNSLPAYFCAAGNGGSALAGSLAVPVITSPAGSVFTTATTTITGTTDANATVYLYINSDNVQTITASTGGIFSFTGLNLLAGQQLYLAVELNTGTVTTSKCESQTAVFTVGCYTQPPLVSADNNNQLTAGAPITGTSVEPSGTSIRVYTSANVLVATAVVQANGTWSTGNAGTTPATYNAVGGTSYYASAQNGSCSVSTNSATYGSVTATSSARCGSITGPVTAAATTISGALTGSFTTTTVNLYLDGQLIGSASTNNTAWGPINVNSTATNTIYSNGVLTIGVQENAKQEIACPLSTLTISCSPTPVAPAFSPANITINQNQAVTYTVSNATSGSFYALADSSNGQSLGQGKWAFSNGSLVITTNPFATPGTYKLYVRSTSLSGITQCSALSTTGTVVVNPVVLAVTLMDFQGKKMNGNILLSWSTENEVRFSRFEIERSNNGSGFYKIGKVAARGGDIRTNYYYNDVDPLSNVSYYRLKMVDADGKFVYSKVIVLTGSGFEKMVLSAVNPNPFHDRINFIVTVEKQEQILVEIVDFSGRTVHTKQLEAKTGSNQVTLEKLNVLPGGIYVLQLKTTDAVVQQRLVKSN